MRIVIDMQGAQTESRFRGVGRYSLAFSKAVARNRGEHEVLLALSGSFPETIEPLRAEFDGLLPQENIRIWYAPGPVKEKEPNNTSRREVAELLREAFLASLMPDVIHVTSLFEGYVDDAVSSIGRFDRRTPVSVTLYDLIPLLNPDQYLKPNPMFSAYYDRKVRFLKRSEACLAISEYSRQEGLDCLGVEKERIVNVSTAIDPKFKSINISEEVEYGLRKKLDLTRPFVLYTGGCDERKNLPRLIQAWAELPQSVRQSHQLLLAGRMLEENVTKFRRIAKNYGVKPDELLFSGYVNDDELVQLYNICKLYVFPSWHEGFGLPALEAMACGAPVIGANTTSLPEVIGLPEALFDPFDVSAISKKIEISLTDSEYSTMLLDHAKKQCERFSWDKTGLYAISVWEGLKKYNLCQSERNLTMPVRSAKPRLAFVSPLPPERTGIADYSSELIPALAGYYDITVITDQEKVEDSYIAEYCSVRGVSWFKDHGHEMDRVVYQVGNSPFHRQMPFLLREIPGVVVLHDFFLSSLFAWLEEEWEENAWVDSLYKSHGYLAVRERYESFENAVRDYPVNFDIISQADGVIVHSEYSRHLAKEWYGCAFSEELQVINHLRSAENRLDKMAARKELGFSESDFVICSFGFLGFTKLNHRLLESWLDSSMSNERNCYLVFVGEIPRDDYGHSLINKINKSSSKDRVKVTGFAPREKFKQYLAAADLAVQLRAHSRGETSGTILDCMSYGVPLIVNANGSMAELSPDAVWMLPDDFENSQLIEALESLWNDPEARQIISTSGRDIIKEKHSPENCANNYAYAIEHFFNVKEFFSTSRLINDISSLSSFNPGDYETIELSSAIAKTFPAPKSARSIYLDVTATSRNDLKTGIERVARALIISLLEISPMGYRVEPVYLSHENGGWCYRHAVNYTLQLLGCPSSGLEDEVAAPVVGDFLLVLDLSGDMLVQAEKAGLYNELRDEGVLVYATIYDLLPVRMPEVFPPGADQGHELWLDSISRFDGAVCISRSVANDLSDWRDSLDQPCEERRDFSIDWFHLGADVTNTAPTLGLPNDADRVIQKLTKDNTFLMVGTIEPRKGYAQVLEAFSQLWAEGVGVNLVIIGGEGWKGVPDYERRDIPKTVFDIRNHPECGKHLYWLEGISDEYLEKIYAASTCLIAASYGEGFGLPLIESAQHKLPIIARDIPVFREVAGEHAFYFDSKEPSGLATSIREWLKLYEESAHPTSDDMPWLTWKESAQKLLEVVTKSY